MNEKQFTIIWVVALVIILLAGGGAIWYLQFDVLEENRAALKVVKGKVADAKSKKEKIKGLKESIVALTKQANDLGHYNHAHDANDGDLSLGLNGLDGTGDVGAADYFEDVIDALLVSDGEGFVLPLGVCLVVDGVGCAQRFCADEFFVAG